MPNPPSTSYDNMELHTSNILPLCKIILIDNCIYQIKSFHKIFSSLKLDKINNNNYQLVFLISTLILLIAWFYPHDLLLYSLYHCAI